MKLSKEKCEPCVLGTPPMDPEQAEKQLKLLDEGWLLGKKGDKIIKEWKKRDFVEAVKLLNKFAEISEQQDHHPKMTLSWGKLVTSIKTDKSGGLTINDFILAAKFDEAEQIDKG